MALMTYSEVKTFLRETSTDYDALIQTYIPVIEEDICEYVNHYFEDKAVFVEYSGGLAFHKSADTSSDGTSTRDYITDDNQNFSTAGLSSGMDIFIAGGSNSMIRTISSGQTSETLYMTGAAAFIDQDQDASHKTVGPIRISRIKWPESLKPIAAKMIWYQIDKAKPDGAIREQIDDYSVAFAGAREYPMQLINQLVKWKQARTH